MKMLQQNVSVSLSQVDYFLLAPLRGTIPIDMTGGFVFPDVDSTDYFTILEVAYGVEDVGFLEVLSIELDALITAQSTASSSLRWQISGDGGNNYVTMMEGECSTFGGGRVLNACGLWITTINDGENQLAIRYQIKTTDTLQPVTNIGIFDFPQTPTDLFVSYRKTVIF